MSSYKIKPPLLLRPVTGSWSHAESKLGTRLPDDYKSFLASYGRGGLDDFLWIYTPDSPVLDDNIAYACERERECWAGSLSRGVTHKYEIYPRPNGVLPWARTDNGDVVFWLAQGEPNKWSIVLAASDLDIWEEYDMCATAFLEAIAGRSIRSAIFPDDFPATNQYTTRDE